MARFVDKQDLPQYKYFNNMVGREQEIRELAGLYLTGDVQLTGRRGQNDSKEYRTSFLMLKFAGLPSGVWKNGKLKKQQAEISSHKYTPSGGNRVRTPKYIDQNSIKIFDMKPDTLPVDHFTKRRGCRGIRRGGGCEKAPHTRRGHYRKYRNGKTVYVSSSDRSRSP